MQNLHAEILTCATRVKFVKFVQFRESHTELHKMTFYQYIDGIFTTRPASTSHDALSSAILPTRSIDTTDTSV